MKRDFGCYRTEARTDTFARVGEEGHTINVAPCCDGTDSNTTAQLRITVAIRQSCGDRQEV